MTKRIALPFALTEAYIARLAGKLLDERHYNPSLLVGGEDVDVYKPDGSPLLVFRRHVLPAAVCRQAYPALWQAAQPSDRRWDLESGVIGFLDRPRPRITAFTGPARTVAGRATVPPRGRRRLSASALHLRPAGLCRASDRPALGDPGDGVHYSHGQPHGTVSGPPG